MEARKDRPRCPPQIAWLIILFLRHSEERRPHWGNNQLGHTDWTRLGQMAVPMTTGKKMRGKRIGQDASNGIGGVDKHVPPAFISRREAGRSPRRWWGGLTSSGRVTVVLAVLVAAALAAGIAFSFTGSSTSGTATPPVGREPRPEPRPPAKKKPVVTFSFSSSNARIDIAVLAAGLRMMLDEIADTAGELDKELRKTFDAQEGGSGTLVPREPKLAREDGLTAKLDVLADGSDGDLPPESGTPVSDIAGRYLSSYRRYLGLLTSMRAAAEAVQATTPELSTARDTLLKACDDLARDTSAVIAGLERLGADPVEDAQVAAGIEAANRRISESKKQVKALIQSISRSNP